MLNNGFCPLSKHPPTLPTQARIRLAWNTKQNQMTNIHPFYDVYINMYIIIYLYNYIIISILYIYLYIYIYIYIYLTSYEGTSHKIFKTQLADLLISDHLLFNNNISFYNSR